MEEQEYRGFFDRIRLFNFMAKDIVAFAAQKYGPSFVDYMDMNCGAMPEGEYEAVIDQGAPLQFLELYAGMVMKRLELSSKKILELGDGFDSVLKNYFFNEGLNLGIKKPETIAEAYGLVRTCSLDSFFCEDDISVQNEKEMQWTKKNNAFHFYWIIVMAALISGIFDKSTVAFSVSENLEFCLETKDSVRK